MVIKQSIKFEKDLYNLINNCGLPVDTAFYILKSVYLDFQNTLIDCAKNEEESFEEETVHYDVDPKTLQAQAKWEKKE